MEDVFDEMAEKWPSVIVARTEIENFTGGMLSAKYCANLDSMGVGCPVRIRMGRRVGYPVSEFAAWLRGRPTAPNRVKSSTLSETQKSNRREN